MIDDPYAYDPKEHGALCDQCIMQPRCTPVPPELRQNSILTVVAESAGANEVRLLRPLVGASGREMMRGFNDAGLRREHLSLTNAVLGQPPENLAIYTIKAKRAIKAREKAGKTPKLLPTDACWPRLIQELHLADNLFLMGSFSRSVVYAHDQSEEKSGRAGSGETGLMRSRGFPDQVVLPGIPGEGERKVNVLSSVHAAFVLRRRRWTTVFRGDIAKVVRMARGKLTYKEPELLFDPSPKQLANFLTTLGKVPAYDIETDMNGVCTPERNLRCIGIGDAQKVTCVPWDSVERPKRYIYSPAQMDEVTNILIEWFGDRTGIVSDQNGQFDKSVVQARIPGMKVRRRRFDTVIGHHVIWSELKHDLGFLSAQYTDQPQHKAVDHDAWVSDYELHKYCMFDVSTTASCAVDFAKDERLQGQKKAFKTDMWLSEFCREMHELGVMVDIFERDGWYKKLGEEAEEYVAKARVHAENALGKKATHARRLFARDINPNSHHQVRSLLFNDLGLKPVPEKAGGYTDAGDPRVGKDQIFYLIDQGLPRKIEDFLLSVIDYREAIKLRGTYCDISKLDRNGRIHPSWKPHVVLSGRLSCSDPNLMNVRKALRSIYRAAPGNIFVAWDKAQLEARVVAEEAQELEQIRAFKAGEDIHRVNARDILELASVEDVSDDERQFCKTFGYAAQYLASKRKVWQMVRNFVNPKTGERDYRDLSYEKAEATFNRFWASRANVMAYHIRNRAYQEQHGYLYDKIDGRRRYFLDGGGDESVKEEMANFIIQSTSAADMNRVTRKLADEFPWGFAGEYTGIVQQCHDSLLMEVPEEMAIEVGVRGLELLYSEFGGMPLPMDMQIGHNYRDLTEYVYCPSCKGVGCSFCDNQKVVTKKQAKGFEA